MDGSDIKNVLASFPSYVNIYETVIKQSKTFVESVIEKRISEEKTDTFDNEIEKLKGYNLLSFLFFVLDDRKEAIRYNKLAQEVNDRNINALACRTFYHFTWLEFYEGHGFSQKLKCSEKSDLDIVFAKAEVAYLFSKFRIDFYLEAEQRFEHVLNESENCDVPDLFLCSWYLSLAQTIKRRLNIHNAPTVCGPKESEVMCKRVINLFTDIINKKSDGIKRYRARAFTELGLVLYASDLRAEYTHKECIQHALELGPEDDFVLERCGKYFRMTRKKPKAFECFDRALKVNETSHSHHHLALCYKGIIISKQIETDNSLIKDSSSVDWRNRPRAWSSRGRELSRDKSNTRVDRDHLLKGKNINSTKNVPWSRPEYNQTRETLKFEKNQNLSKIVKCPNKLLFIPPTEIDNVIEHLDKAIEISHGTNTGALYDKGLIHRASKQLDQAISNFKLIINNTSSTDLQLCNAYEQAALCMIEKVTEDFRCKEKFEFDAKEYLMKAIELSLNMIRKVPNLQNCWHSKPSLKKLLLRQANTKDTLRELARYYKLLEKYENFIDMSRQILDIEEDEEERKKVLIDVIKANLKVGDNNGAILLLEMTLCLPGGVNDLEKGLLIETYIKGGLDAWKCGELELAKRRIKSALFYSRQNKSEFLDYKYDKVFDLFILSSHTSEDKARQLCSFLKTIGLNTTLNSDDVLPGLPVRSEIMDRIDNSQFVAIFIGAEDEQTDLVHLKTYTDIISRRFQIISENGRAERDSLYSKYPLIKLECEMVDGNGNITSHLLEWFEDFFHMISE